MTMQPQHATDRTGISRHPAASCPAGRPGRALAFAAAVLLLLALVACSMHKVPYQLQDIAGLVPRLQFSLQDDNGNAVTAANFRGRIVLLYFGYTHCPDACPTTLAMLKGVMANLGQAAANVDVLFVSVDPRRDSDAALKTYLGYFNPAFIGLRSDSDAPLAALAKRYRIAYRLDAPDRYGDYAVEHSNAIFIFDRNGKASLLASSADTPQAITHDLRLLLGTG